MISNLIALKRRVENGMLLQRFADSDSKEWQEREIHSFASRKRGLSFIAQTSDLRHIDFNNGRELSTDL